MDNNFFLEEQWKVDKIIKKTSEWSYIDPQECHDLYCDIIKNCPTTIIEVYKAYIKVKETIPFQVFYSFIYHSSRAGVSGKKAGEQLKNKLQELLCTLN